MVVANEKMYFIINCVLNKVFQCALNVCTHTSVPCESCKIGLLPFFVRVVHETVFISLNRKNRLTVNTEIEHHNSKKYQSIKTVNMCYGQMLHIKYRIKRMRKNKTSERIKRVKYVHCWFKSVRYSWFVQMFHSRQNVIANKPKVTWKKEYKEEWK